MTESLAMAACPQRQQLIVARLRRVQATAGALFFIFLLLHLSNTVVAIWSADAYNDYQRLLKQFYQHPLIELTIVIGPLVAHIVAGIWLYRLRKKGSGKPRFSQRVNSWAGLFLLLVVLGHVLATRGVGYWYDAAPEFAGVSFSLWWMPGYFYPYYFLLFMAGLYHSSTGLGLLLARLGYPMLARAKKPQGVVMLLGAGAVSAALLAFGGHLYDIADPRDNNYARAYGSIMGIELERQHSEQQIEKND